MDLAGLPVLLIDTAGLRDSNDAIEAEGVRRALALAERADLVLALRAIDSSPNQTGPTERHLRVATKIDLSGSVMPGEIGVSAITGEGMPALLDSIVARLSSEGATEPALLTRERHRMAVSDAIEALERMTQARHGQAELLAEDVRLAVAALERLVGRIDVEDVLDQLFSGFCIGK